LNVAKTSKIVRNEQRRELVAKYAAKRAALKETLRKPETSPADRKAARAALQSLPANSNPVRIRNRCAVTGRPRGYYSKFGLSRLSLRDLALKGELPGVVKSSW
jgi:small subunit ribosomal protein S14